jgi:hypothetical protein
MEGLMEESESPVSLPAFRLRTLAVVVTLMVAALVAYFAGVSEHPAAIDTGDRAAYSCMEGSGNGRGESTDCVSELPGLAAAGRLSDAEWPATSGDPAIARAQRSPDPNAEWRNLLRREPTMTVAELCAAGLDDTGLHCDSWAWKATDAKDTSGAGAHAASAKGQITSGRVIGPDGLGIGAVTVLASAIPHGDNIEQADESARSVRYRTMTDSTGFYSFHDLPAGDYLIRTGAIENYRSVRISVRAGVTYADLVLKQEDDFVVHGRVLSSEGYPLSGAVALPLVTGMPSVSTDEDGYYQLPVVLKSGVRSINLRFQSPGHHEEYASAGLEQLLAPDGAVVDVVMRPVNYWTAVSGTVSDTAGKSLAGKTVQLRPLGNRRRYSTVTDADGEFQFHAVEAPFDYRIHVSGGPSHEDYSRRLHVTVDESEFHVVVGEYEFGEVAGRFVHLHGSPIPDFELVLRNTSSSIPHALISSDSDGNFALPQAPAGDLVMATRSTPSILVRGVHLDPGDDLYVPVVLDWGEHEIRGLVVDRPGNPVPASRIVLKWAHQEGGVSSMSTRRTAADANGSFLFSQLGPGAHSLEVDAPGFRPVSLDHDASREGYELTVRLN